MGKRIDAIRHGWDAFVNGQSDSYSDPFPMGTVTYGGQRPDRPFMRIMNDRSIISSIYTRIAVDFAGVTMRHIRLDENERYAETIDSGLNNCLKVEANLDQAGRMFRQDIANSMFDKGVIAVVPIRTSLNPNQYGGYDIQDMRVGTIVKWYPRHVRVDLYNDRTGKREEITLDKKFVAIIENPLYSIMNEPNSTLQRLIRKLSILDVIDEQSGSGKLDIIIQLPYTIRSDQKRQQAEQRRKDIEFQLKGSQYGIAYADSTEKITQLNRPAENNLMKQIEYLIGMLYGQLGLTPEIMNGTADEAAMLNYYNRTIEPILDAVAEEFRRKFLTKTARTQGQTIEYYRNPFQFVPLQQLGEIVNNLSRNEVASANELRPLFGLKPHKDPKADQLNNSNINPNQPAPPESAPPEVPPNQEGEQS